MTQGPLNITSLPAELLWKLIHNVISKQDLCQLRSVNSLFETLATREIFNSITVRNNKQSADRFWNMLLTPRLASRIQSISFVEEDTLAEREVWKRLEVAFSILHQAPGLKTLKFDFHPYLRDFNPIQTIYYSHQWDIVYALGSNRNRLPALQSLNIYGLLCCKAELRALFFEEPLEWLAASLSHLSFTVPRMTSVNGLESLKSFWEDVVVRCMLQPAVNLESLVIDGSGGKRDAQFFDVSQAQLATFPRLATLSLRHIVWKDDISGQGDMVPLEFIVSHQKTLKNLELHNCAINVRKRIEPPHYYWADIHKRLANALTGLVELKVEFKLQENEVPYVFSNDNTNDYGYFKKGLQWTAPDAVLEQDALALEEFRAVVKSQGMGAGSRFRP